MPSRLVHSPIGPLEVGPVPPEATYQLRQQVLRPHQPLEEMHLLDSSHKDAVAIGAVSPESGEVVGTAAVSPEEAPARLAAEVAARPAWRLRSMATRAELRGAGVGAAVLAAVVEHVARHGGGLLWCNARTPARSFYERAGFSAFGEEWIDEAIGPHIVMWRLVPGCHREEEP